MSSQTKKDITLSPEAAAKDNTKLKCGDCLHFKGTSHPMYGEVCSNRGVKTFATAPNCYTPNVVVFRKAGPDTLRVLSGIISGFTPSQSRVLMGLLKGAGALEKRGLSFMQKVYHCFGEDYLDNYVSGYVLGLGLEDTILVVGQDYLRNSSTMVVSHLMRSSLITQDEFKSKRKSLIESGKVYQPRRPHKNIKIDEKYEPPTLETSVDELEKAASRGEKKKKTRTLTVEIE
jgi:hypothetical protein